MYAQTGLAQLAGCTGVDCSACNVVSMANGLIRWLIGILFVVFAVLLAVAGVRLVTSGGNHHALDEAKSTFTNAIIGFMIILASWLIVDTIMRALVGTDGNPGQIVANGTASGYLFWSQVQCQEYIKPGYKPIDEEEIKRLEAEFQDVPYADISYVVVNPTSGNSSGGGMPTGGTGSGANCPVPAESGMVTIPGTNYKARPNVASNFVRMRTAAAAAGIRLTVISGYRSEAKQVSIWKSKGCDVNPNLCKNKAARPCSFGGNGSNHNGGNAVDIGESTYNSAAYNWLKKYGGGYGFYNALGAPDPVHWSATGR